MSYQFDHWELFDDNEFEQILLKRNIAKKKSKQKKTVHYSNIVTIITIPAESIYVHVHGNDEKEK